MVIDESDVPPRTVDVYAVLAMAYCGLDQPGEAQAALATAEKRERELSRESNWQDVLIARLLLREAKSLLSVPLSK